MSSGMSQKVPEALGRTFFLFYFLFASNRILQLPQQQVGVHVATTETRAKAIQHRGFPGDHSAQY